MRKSPSGGDKIRAPRGTRDVIPPEVQQWHRVESSARRMFALYGFGEIRTPIFENSAVFEKGTGAGSEIVQKEMYRFTDLGGHDLTLRPELTPPVVRAYIEHNLGHSADPQRFFYIGPTFRYERPQKGRYRQFHQIGVEAFGSESAAVDAEIIDMAMSWLGGLGLESLHLKLNSVGDGTDRPAYMELLRAALRERFDELSEDSRRRCEINPLRVFDSKDRRDHAVIEQLPTIVEHLSADNRAHFDEVCGYLDDWQVEYTVEPRLVRGLDYYRRTVFEISSAALGAQDALLGGGRYDGLVAELGGEDVPGVGFASGLERIVLALPGADRSGAFDCYVVTVSAALLPDAMRVLRRLREAGVRCTADFQGRSMKAQMKAANRSAAPMVVILGPDELEKGVCNLKSMASGEQREVPLGALADELRKSDNHASNP